MWRWRVLGSGSLVRRSNCWAGRGPQTLTGRWARRPARLSPTTTWPWCLTGWASLGRRPRPGPPPPRGAPGGGSPSLLVEGAALEGAVAAEPADATAMALLGHWCYAQGRHGEALA